MRKNQSNYCRSPKSLKIFFFEAPSSIPYVHKKESKFQFTDENLKSKQKQEKKNPKSFTFYNYEIKRNDSVCV